LPVYIALAVNSAQPTAHLFLGRNGRGHDVVVGRANQPLAQQVGAGVLGVLKKRDVTRVEHDHSPACRRSSSRIRCPAWIISFITGSPANMPNVRFQSSQPVWPDADLAWSN